MFTGNITSLMKTFVELLSPYSTKVFFEKNWTKEAALVSREISEQYTNLLSWEKINHLLNFHKFEYPNLRLIKNGETKDANANNNLTKHCQDGASLVMDSVDRLIPEIAKLIFELKQDVGCSVHTSTCISWPSRQGFSCHYDPHEVFILQIDGKKVWSVYEDTIKYPLERFNISPPTDRPYLNCVLNPGDLLYIPRGHWHHALALDQPSLHLAIGMRCQTGIDFLNWLVNQLMQEERWRANIPLFSDNVSSASTHIDTLIQNLKEHSESKNIFLDYINSTLSSQERGFQHSLPFQAGYNIFPQGMNTRFVKPKFQKTNILEFFDSVNPTLVGDKHVVFNKSTKTLLKKLSSKQSFTVNDVLGWLPDLNWETDVAPLLSWLVLEGIILVDYTYEFS